jgi:GR25 family glycosyltransferase involved in LPS biosynthesis
LYIIIDVYGKLKHARRSEILTFNEYFDKIFCINLDRRTDRWAKSLEQFQRHSIRVERISAVDGSKTGGNGKLNPGQFGCSQSHASVLNTIIKEGLNRVLILEDDIEFAEDLNERFANTVSHIPERWDMLYLGASHREKPIVYNSVLAKVRRSFTTHAYAINDTSSKAIINHIEKFNAPVDVVYSELHRNGHSYVFSPHVAWQRPNYSDILRKHIDYSNLLKR